jgi:hypothetical protein
MWRNVQENRPVIILDRRFAFAFAFRAEENYKRSMDK